MGVVPRGFDGFDAQVQPGEIGDLLLVHQCYGFPSGLVHFCKMSKGVVEQGIDGLREWIGIYFSVGRE